MITIQRVCSVLLVSIGIAACGSAEPPPPPPVKDTVFGDMVGTMDKARAVQDTTMQHKQALDQAIQETEGADH